MKTVTIVGAGRLGCALAIALARSGYEVERLVYRRHRPADAVRSLLSGHTVESNINDVEAVTSDIVLITTQDTEIESAAEDLLGKTHATVVLHTSGSLPSDVLKKLRSDKTNIGSVHPLVSVSDPVSGSEKFSGAYFCVEGEPAAVRTADKLARAIGALTFSIPTESKPLYHAAAVMSSGHLVALTETAASVLEKCDVEPTTARSILMPLIESTIDNLKRQESAGTSMTGTYARLDVPAFRRHLASLEVVSDELTTEIYLDLAIRSLEILEAVSPDKDSAEEFRKEVYIAKRNRRVIK